MQSATNAEFREQVRQMSEQIRQQVQEQVNSHIRDRQAGVPLPPAPPAPPGAPDPGNPGLPGEPVVGVPPQLGPQVNIPPEAVDLSLAFFAMVAVCVIGWPIARALGRRIERRPVEPAQLPDATSAQLTRIEQAVEAMAIEVERISENQRFLTRVQAERERALSQGS